MIKGCAIKSAAAHWLLLSIILISMTAHAENGCPPGMLPASGTDINSCAPIPPGYYGNQQEPPQQPRPTTRWKDQWGAIATDGPGGHLGVASALSSRNAAERTALSDCEAKGGLDCKLENSYGNACVAMVVGDKGHNANSAATQDAAVQLGMKVCNSTDSQCHLYYSDCSMPVRIQ